MTKTIEWPTLAVLIATYAVWGLATAVVAAWWLPAGISLAAIAIAQYSSLQHEALHGHPFRSKWLNTAIVFPALLPFIPYMRFRALHLAHHRDSELTDPFDDPESNYLDAGTWERLPWALQVILNANNTLAGRLALGPAIGTFIYYRDELRGLRRDPAILRGWLWHIPAFVPVALWLNAVGMPLWAYALACYGAMSLLRIRTFLEHQAHEKARGRTVIIEDRGPLSLLFLNNNYHVIHHIHPRVPWYRLPELYRKNADRYLRQNEGYFYRSYAEVFRLYLFRRKDPVPHPIWRRG